MNIPRQILFLFILLPCFAYAQQQVKGLVFKAGTADRIAQALVTNTKTNSIMMADELGIFNIKASAGDTLLINKKGYAPGKHIILTNDDIIVYLQPNTGIVLEEVTIKGQTKQQELSEIMGDYRAKGTFFNGKPPALLFLTSPLTGLYELFGKTPRNAAHFARFTRAELEQNEINKRYNKEFVKRITGITTDDEAQKFMDYYSPSYEDIKSWNDYELVKHVKRGYQHYKNAPPQLNPFK